MNKACDMHTQTASNYYEILGVEHLAPLVTITAAYRRLAMRWHPDRHQDLEQKVVAERMFKSVKEAYETLSDETKRQRYNELRGFSSSTSRPNGEESVSARWRRQETEAQRQHAQSQRQQAEAEQQRQADAEHQRAEAERRRRASLPTGRDIKKKVSISLDQAIRGGSIELTFKAITMCERCQGKGKAPRSCASCGGKGYTGTRSCPHCSGPSTCGVCKGVGKRHELRTIALRTPAGVIDASVLTADGRGHASTKGGLPGDLVMTIAIKAPGHWSVKAADLHGTLKIGFPTAMLGGDVTVELPTGKTLEVKIPPRTNSGTKIRLAGQGLYSKKGNTTGDVVLHVSIVLPKARRHISPEAMAALRELD